MKHPVPSATIQKQTPWQIQRAVVFAVFVRELRTRFGQFQLGYLWAILEPLSMILILSFVRMIFGRSDIAGLSFPVFFASGVIPYLLFIHIIQGSLSTVEGNLSLFNYQRVKPFDIVFARSILELLISIGTALIIFPGMHWLGYTFHWNDTLQVATVLGCLYIMSFGVGLMLCVLGPMWQEAKKVVPVMLRPLFFISGVFFPVVGIPEAARPLALLNPLLHFVELMRGAMFQEFEAVGASLFYAFCWAVGCLLVGMWVYRVNRVKIVTSGTIR
ncbi:MAG: ABC transporter permease [Verrucomicrobia bacterium]|jgi:capsular polysaccharide transport system permease protein|nr:ABC transporter permease [Verrucomicrobiota bacterium]